MDKDIKIILKDIYQIDPGLERLEKELIKIIKKLIEAKPEMKFDGNFIRQLKQELLAEASEMKHMKKTSFDWKIFSTSLAGTALVIFLALSWYYWVEPSRNISMKKIDGQNDLIRIARLEDGAFGNLFVQESGAVDSIVSGSAPEGRGLGGGELTSAQIETKMISPMYNYSYIYEGEDFSDLLLDKMPVYKKRKVDSRTGDLAGKLMEYDFGLIDLSKFKDMEVNSFNIVENRELGYLVSISPKDNFMYITKNWESWPNPTAGCQIDECFEKARLKESDVPSDQEIKEIVQTFINEYNIDTEGYGDSEINDQWRQERFSGEGRVAYVPEEIMVTYPLVLEGQSVRNEGGGKIGLYFHVDIRNKKVSNFSGQIIDVYDSSEYEMVDDQSRLKELAENGGSRNYLYRQENVEELKLKLGYPEIVLVQTWNYNEQRSASEELYVPALAFPVIEKPQEAFYYQDFVIVHLTKEILDERMRDNWPEPIIEPMIMDEAVSSSQEK